MRFKNTMKKKKHSRVLFFGKRKDKYENKAKEQPDQPNAEPVVPFCVRINIYFYQDYCIVTSTISSAAL